MDGDSWTIAHSQLSADKTTMVLTMLSRIPAYARIVVTYDKPASNPPAGSGGELASFTRVVKFRPNAQDVYDALKEYFSGTGTLSGRGTLSVVEDLLQQAADGQSYHEKLLEKVEDGELDDIVPGPESAWGDPGTEDWAQMGHGFPKCIYDQQGNCIDMSETWGSQYSCGGRPQPGLADNDFGNFFWACTGDGQWVPVRRPRPGVDYSHDNDLVRPPAEPGTDPDYNEKCRYVRRHPDGHPQAGEPVLDENGNRIPEPVHRYNGDGTWTTTRGANYDPIDGSCRGRG